MQYLLRTLIVLLLFSLCEQINAQTTERIGFSVVQNVLPDGISCTYKFKKSKLRIYKECFWNKNKRVFSKKLRKEQKDSVENYICRLVGMNFLANYSEPILDGINWDFKLICGEDSKEIYFDNATIVEFEDFLDFLNSLIPKKKRFITMHHPFAKRQ